MSEKCYVVRRHYFTAKVVEYPEFSLSKDIDPLLGFVAVCDEAGLVLLVNPKHVFTTREEALLKAAAETKRFRRTNLLWVFGIGLALFGLLMVAPIVALIGIALYVAAISLTEFFGSEMEW